MNINIPNKIDSEKSVLGAMFLDQEALAKSCDLLTHDSFYDEKNKIIFELFIKFIFFYKRKNSYRYNNFNF